MRRIYSRTTLRRHGWAVCAFHSTGTPCRASKPDGSRVLVCPCADVDALRGCSSASEATPDDRTEGRTHLPLISGGSGPCSSSSTNISHRQIYKQQCWSIATARLFLFAWTDEAR